MGGKDYETMKDYRDETWKELKAVVLEELNFYDEVTDEVASKRARASSYFFCPAE